MRRNFKKYIFFFNFIENPLNESASYASLDRLGRHQNANGFAKFHDERIFRETPPALQCGRHFRIGHVQHQTDFHVARFRPNLMRN